MTWKRKAQIQTMCGQSHELTISEGNVVFIAGPNGVGKSALLFALYRSFSNAEFELLPGHRQIIFQSDDTEQMQLPLETFSLNQYQDALAHSRTRNAWGETHLKSVLKRVVNKEHAIDRSIANDIRANKSNAEALSNRTSIITDINSIFELSRLPIRLVLIDGLLRAQRGTVSYGIDKLSDGERAALLLVGSILVQPTNGIIAIDEPEKHLNPGISGPLISS